MNKLKWSDLIVTDTEGDEMGTLGGIVEYAPANLDTATISDGKIDSWPQYFLSAPGEDPDWDTPRVPVNWNGFSVAIKMARR